MHTYNKQNIIVHWYGCLYCSLLFFLVFFYGVFHILALKSLVIIHFNYMEKSSMNILLNVSFCVLHTVSHLE